MSALGRQKNQMTWFARRRRTIAGWAAALLSLSGVPAAGAADVFASVGADGVVRYATQALDDSYRVIYREPVAQAPNAAPPSGRVAGARASARARQLQPLIERIARQHGLAPGLVEAVIAIESGHNPDAVSPRGAQGAMQLLPATAARYGVTTAVALRDPARNIDAGVRHLKDLLAQYQGNVALALAAYNAGAGAVSRHGGRIPPYRETMLYVPAVLARSALNAHP